MREKLLSLPYDKWYDISSRSDLEAITATLRLLVEQGYHFEISSERRGLFRRLKEKTIYEPADIFEATKGQEGYEVRTRKISQYTTAQELYFNNKLISIK